MSKSLAHKSCLGPLPGIYITRQREAIYPIHPSTHTYIRWMDGWSHGGINGSNRTGLVVTHGCYGYLCCRQGSSHPCQWSPAIYPRDTRQPLSPSPCDHSTVAPVPSPSHANVSQHRKTRKGNEKWFLEEVLSVGTPTTTTTTTNTTTSRAADTNHPNSCCC